MHRRLLSTAAAIGFAFVLGHTPALAQSNPALTGKVTSAEEGAMEGVVVSAKKGIVTVSVVSNDKGEFSFPASKLGAGDYALTIRAVGYDLDGPKNVKLEAGKPASIDVKLSKTTNSRGAAHQPRMDAQRSRHRRSEARAHRLHQLPQRRAHPQFELQRRRVPDHHQADGALLQQQPLQEAAGPRRRARHQRLRPERRQGRRLLRQHQHAAKASAPGSSRRCRASPATAPR